MQIHIFPELATQVQMRNSAICSEMLSCWRIMCDFGRNRNAYTFSLPLTLILLPIAGTGNPCAKALPWAKWLHPVTPFYVLLCSFTIILCF